MKINEENLKNLSKQSLFHYQKLFPVLTKEKNKQYGMLGLTFITLTIFGIFAINPTITTIVELQKKVEDARFVDQQLSQKITNLQSLRSQYDGLQSDLIYVDQALPKKPLLVRFIGQVQAIANTSNVQLTSFQIESITLTSGNLPVASDQLAPQQAKTETRPYAFSLGVSGPYQQVRQFLSSLTDFERITTISSISVSRGSIESQSITLQVEGTTFYKP